MDTVVYVPTSGITAADTLSNGLWSLARPGAERAADDTQQMFSTIRTLDDKTWLQVLKDFAIDVCPTAELGDIATVLQPWVDAGNIPSSVIDDLRATVISLRGQRLVVWDAFPLFFQQQAKSHDDLVQMNLLRALP